MIGMSDDFASLMKGAPQGRDEGRTGRRLRPGEVVEGTIVQVGKDSIFVDVGATSEGRIERSELADKHGQLHVVVGDKIRASVARVTVDGPELVISVGRGARGGIDASVLKSAQESRLPVQGTVSRVVKGGVEVDISGIRAFCPASQLDKAYIADLSTFAGQTLDFLVSEIKDDGRSVVVSRRALLEEEQARTAQAVLERIATGGEYEGKVTSLQKYGAFIDLGGGVEGLVHVSELAHGRVERVEDMLSLGDTVTVRVLAVEPQDKSPIPKLRLSVKALQQAPKLPELQPDEVLEGTVAKIGSYGVRVETTKGSGLVPMRELGLPRGSDPRRAFPLGSKVKVVLVHRDASGKTTFSFSRVASVEESANYREFTRGGSTHRRVPQLGSLGDVLRQKLGLPEQLDEEPPDERDEPKGVAAPASPQQAPRKDAQEPASPRPLPEGVIKRQR